MFLYLTLFPGPIEVGYVVAETTTERETSTELCLRVLNFPSAPRPFSLTATTQDGSASRSLYLHCLKFNSFNLVAGSDYIGIMGHILEFEIGQDEVCHNIEIIDDTLCEMPFEDFVSVLDYASGRMPIIITQSTITVYINDIEEPECG